MMIFEAPGLRAGAQTLCLEVCSSERERAVLRPARPPAKVLAYAQTCFRRSVVGVVCLLVFSAFDPSSLAADETGLLAVWNQHTESPDDRAGTIAACEAFAKSNPGDVFVPVVQEIRAWHLLKEGEADKAKQILESFLLPRSDPVHKGSLTVAKGWLTRLDRETVRESLKLYYRKEVGFPPGLGAISRHPKLPKQAHPVLQDRFGDPWQYRLTGIKGLAKFQNQRYELLSARLGDQSDLETALQSSYAFNIRHQPVQVLTNMNPPQVTFKTSDGNGAAAAFPVGSQSGGIHLAYAGQTVIVVCSHSYWKVFPTP